MRRVALLLLVGCHNSSPSNPGAPVVSDASPGNVVHCTGTLGFPGQPITPEAVGRFLLADFDGDGKLDIVSKQAAVAFRGNGDGTFVHSNPVGVSGVDATAVG